MKPSTTVRTSQEQKKDGSLDMHEMKLKTKSGTQSPSSEASWNSRSDLLPKIGKNIFTTLIGCKSNCSNYKSVEVIENTAFNKRSISSKRNADFGEVKTMKPSWFKEESPSGNLDKVSSGRFSEDCFTLPITKLGLVKVEKEQETWDANPSSVPEDDADSNTSSGLFEITSLSDNGNPFFRRQASESMSSGTCYEPSEASIDWSVVTASAAVVSDNDEPKPRAIIKKENTPSKNTGKRGLNKFLLWCRSQGAVKVIDGEHKLPGKKSEFKAVPSEGLKQISSFLQISCLQMQNVHLLPFSQLRPVSTTESHYMQLQTFIKNKTPP